jgi:hypothetical protein
MHGFAVGECVVYLAIIKYVIVHDAWAHMGKEEGDAMYLSSAATNQQAIRHGPAEFRPFDGPNGASVHPQWEDLHDKAGALWWLKFLVVT